MHKLSYGRSAAENAARSNKKTVMPKDVFDAMQELEFESFLPRLEAEVQKFTSIQADKRNSYRKKVREEKKALKEGGETKVKAVNGHAAEDESPPTKRARRSSVDNGEHATGSEEEEGADVDETVEDVQEEDEEVEDEGEDEADEEPVEEGLQEDPLEEKEVQPSDDDMADGDESD